MPRSGQRGKSRSSCLGPGPALEPSVDTGEVDGRRGEDVLEVGFRLSRIAAAAQSEAPDALCQGALDTGAAGIVARQSKQVTQRQSAIHPMVEQCLAGELMSSPKPPAARARRARLYSSLPARHHNCRMQLPMDEAQQSQ